MRAIYKAGPDARPDLSLHTITAFGGELCGADRQRESAQIFVATETARNARDLAGRCRAK